MHNFTIDEIFSLENEEQFNQLALRIFHYQAENNEVYKEYLCLLGTNISEIDTIEKIPFLPIEFFKTHRIVTGTHEIQKTFFSSGTTGMDRSNHHISNLKIYEESFIHGFENQYGDIKNYCVLALLPTYLENESSSLVYMVNALIERSGNPHSGFYLNNFSDLIDKLTILEKTGQKTILLGVSYALLDLIDLMSFPLSHTIVMETGGMKGRRKELTKKELHQKLAEGFGLKAIHSEYGMTELLSQAYSKGEGKFRHPAWMKIIIRDTYDPFSYLEKGKSGGINVIDLANIYSCSFIETKDLGKINPDNSFEILGRFDYSDVRGCNLLVSE